MIWETSMSHDRRLVMFVAILVACLAVFLVLPNSSSAQELDGIPEHVVKAALNPRSEVIYSGIMRKQLMPMGDAAAVAITRVLAGKRLQPDTVDRVMLVIEFSFDSPEAIVNQADQTPKTALFVLTSFDQQTLSTEQRKRLSQLRTKLEALASDPDHKSLTPARKTGEHELAQNACASDLIRCFRTNLNMISEFCYGALLGLDQPGRSVLN